LCTKACGDTQCQTPPKHPPPGSACETCIAGSGCVPTVLAACQADAGCLAYVACVSVCSGKP
jgi:hypothetical protein